MIEIVLNRNKRGQVYLAPENKGQVSLFFCRSPPVDLTLKVKLIGGFLVKKIIIDGYEILVDNGIFTTATFRDYNGNEICIELGEKMQVEFQKRRREEFRNQYENRKHIDTYLKNDYLLDTKISKNNNFMEKKVVDTDFEKFIINEIKKLPYPQNKRVYMSVIKKYTYTKIAEMEGVSDTAIRHSVERGKDKLQEKLKKFLY